MLAMVNDYSHTWYSLFLQPIRANQTEAEVAFIQRNLPVSRFPSILDLCCGSGRHASFLADQGYQVLGVDNNASAIAKARELSNKKLTFAVHDMRRIDEISGCYDAVVNLWQSFGYFDDTTNRDILRQIGRKLNPGGRLILDIYNREFFERNEGVRSCEKEGVSVTEDKRMAGARLQVTLSYNDGASSDRFDWQLYTAPEMAELLGDLGFREVIACTDFDESRPPSSDKPRMQLVFEKQV